MKQLAKNFFLWFDTDIGNIKKEKKMNVSAINAVNAAQPVNVMKNVEKEEEVQKFDAAGYEPAEPAPVNAALYQSMMGIENKEEPVEVAEPVQTVPEEAEELKNKEEKVAE